ncbi:MAG: dTDP-glucose 4,6-dehydratase [Planctomycetes bacterium]|nr:dTDP-glucose 4,6-dehydratase [Planctomycetota bacterium]
MNILVTGGCGFIGSHFIKRLLRKYPDYNIVNVDKLTYAGNIKNIPPPQDYNNFTTYTFDIGDTYIRSILKDHEIEVVVNFAAETHVDRSIHNPVDFIQTDIVGLINLVQAARKAKVRRFVQISTDEVYGSLPVGFEADTVARLNPTSPYSASKASADILLLSYFKTYNFPVLIVRPCNNYGPNQYPEKLIPMCITRLLENKRMILHGDGDEVREYVYVEDCCRAIDIIMHKGFDGNTFNVGSGVRRNNREIMSAVLKEVVCNQARIGEEYVKKVPNRPGNDSRYALKCNSLWKSQFLRSNFKDRLHLTIEWYKKNYKDWWPYVDLDANIYKDEEYLR